MRIYVLSKQYVTMPEKNDSLGIPRTIYVEPNDLTFGVPIHSSWIHTLENNLPIYISKHLLLRYE